MNKASLILLIVGLVILIVGCVMRIMEVSYSNYVLLVGCGIIILRSFFRNHDR